jgi:aspartate racemase
MNMQKKVIGIIGGIAPASTVDYYQSIISGYLKRTGTNQYPSILINSINMTKMLGYVAEKQFDLLVKYLNEEIDKLKAGGADFAVLTSNTPHIVFDELRQTSTLPLISIVETTIAYSRIRGFKKLGLFGTKSTMQSGFYQKGAAKENIEIFIPGVEDQDYIHNHYMNEFVKGIFKDDVRTKLVEIALKLKDDYNISGLILGGTEIPLILKPENLPELELINTTLVHVESILDYAMKD